VPLARGGKVRALGTSGLQRSVVMPDIPTISEAGVKGYETTIWFGLMAPSGTPQPLLAKLNSEITRIVSRPEVKKAWSEIGAEPLTMTTAQFERYLSDDITKWRRVVVASGAKPDQ
jgi:tripartite-type tricarboxylate transporter receptor subunit TctC